MLHVANTTPSVMAVFMDLNVYYTGDKAHLRSLIETAAHREFSSFWTTFIVHCSNVTLACSEVENLIGKTPNRCFQVDLV